MTMTLRALLVALLFSTVTQASYLGYYTSSVQIPSSSQILRTLAVFSDEGWDCSNIQIATETKEDVVNYRGVVAPAFIRRVNHHITTEELASQNIHSERFTHSLVRRDPAVRTILKLNCHRDVTVRERESRAQAERRNHSTRRHVTVRRTLTLTLSAVLSDQTLPLEIQGTTLGFFRSAGPVMAINHNLFGQQEHVADFESLVTRTGIVALLQQTTVRYSLNRITEEYLNSPESIGLTNPQAPHIAVRIAGRITEDFDASLHYKISINNGNFITVNTATNTFDHEFLALNTPDTNVCVEVIRTGVLWNDTVLNQCITIHSDRNVNWNRISSEEGFLTISASRR